MWLQPFLTKVLFFLSLNQAQNVLNLANGNQVTTGLQYRIVYHQLKALSSLLDRNCQWQRKSAVPLAKLWERKRQIDTPAALDLELRIAKDLLKNMKRDYLLCMRSSPGVQSTGKITTAKLILTATNTYVTSKKLDITTPQINFTTPKIDFKTSRMDFITSPPHSTPPKTDFNTPNIDLSTPIIGFTMQKTNFTVPQPDFTTSKIVVTSPPDFKTTKTEFTTPKSNLPTLKLDFTTPLVDFTNGVPVPTAKRSTLMPVSMSDASTGHLASTTASERDTIHFSMSPIDQGWPTPVQTRPTFEMQTGKVPGTTFVPAKSTPAHNFTNLVPITMGNPTQVTYLTSTLLPPSTKSLTMEPTTTSTGPSQTVTTDASNIAKVTSNYFPPTSIWSSSSKHQTASISHQPSSNNVPRTPTISKPSANRLPNLPTAFWTTNQPVDTSSLPPSTKVTGIRPTANAMVTTSKDHTTEKFTEPTTQKPKGKHSFHVSDWKNVASKFGSYVLIRFKFPKDGLSTGPNWCSDYAVLCEEYYGRSPLVCPTGKKHSDRSRCLRDYNSKSAPWMKPNGKKCKTDKVVADLASRAFHKHVKRKDAFLLTNCSSRECSRQVRHMKHQDDKRHTFLASMEKRHRDHDKRDDDDDDDDDDDGKWRGFSTFMYAMCV